MALSDCPKCWMTPCECGYMYRGMDPSRREKIARVIAEVREVKQDDKTWCAGCDRPMHPNRDTNLCPRCRERLASDKRPSGQSCEMIVADEHPDAPLDKVKEYLLPEYTLRMPARTRKELGFGKPYDTRYVVTEGESYVFSEGHGWEPLPDHIIREGGEDPKEYRRRLEAALRRQAQLKHFPFQDFKQANAKDLFLKYIMREVHKAIGGVAAKGNPFAEDNVADVPCPGDASHKAFDVSALFTRQGMPVVKAVLCAECRRIFVTPVKGPEVVEVSFVFDKPVKEGEMQAVALEAARAPTELPDLKGPDLSDDWYCPNCDRGLADQECDGDGEAVLCPECKAPVVDAGKWLDDVRGNLVWVCGNCYQGEVLLLARVGGPAPCALCGREGVETSAVRPSWVKRKMKKQRCPAALGTLPGTEWATVVCGSTEEHARNRALDHFLAPDEVILVFPEQDPAVLSPKNVRWCDVIGWPPVNDPFVKLLINRMSSRGCFFCKAPEEIREAAPNAQMVKDAKRIADFAYDSAVEMSEAVEKAVTVEPLSESEAREHLGCKCEGEGCSACEGRDFPIARAAGKVLNAMKDDIEEATKPPEMSMGEAWAKMSDMQVEAEEKRARVEYGIDPRLCSMCQHGTTHWCRRCRCCRHLCKCEEGFEPANPKE